MRTKTASGVLQTIAAEAARAAGLMWGVEDLPEETREALTALLGLLAGAWWQLCNAELCGIASGAAELMFATRACAGQEIPARSRPRCEGSRSISSGRG
jgi:hypothetical protein